MPVVLSKLEVELGEGLPGGSTPAANLVHAVWYGGRGGSGGFIRYLKGILATPAAPLGLRVTLVSSPSLAKELGPVDPAVRILTVPSLDSALAAQFWERTALARFLRDLQPDVLFYPSGGIGAFPARVPVTSVCHNLLFFDDVEYRKYRYSKLWWRSLRRMRSRHRVFYPQTDGIIFTSSYSQQLAQRRVQGMNHWTVISNGVEEDFLAASPTPTIDRPPRNILYVSPVYLYKYQWNVVKAIKQLRESSGEDYQLWLAGSANEDQLGRRELLRVMEKERAGAFTHLMGEVSHDSMPALLRKADVFVFASSCEAFGITLLEAMASGLPVACSNRTGLPDLLRDGGVYFDPEDSTDIASAVRSLCADSAFRRACAERAMRYASQYTWFQCAEKTFTFLREVAVAHEEPCSARRPDRQIDRC